MMMEKDLTVILQDSPGTLADLSEKLAKVGINIEGICATTHKGESAVHILVNDPDGARKALEEGWMEVAAEQEVMVLDIEDRPGTLLEIAHKLANAGVNIELVYLTTRSKLVIGVDNLDKARSVIS